MAIAVMPVMPVYASGTVVVAVSASSLNIGETVTVTATAQGPGGEQTTATLGFNYDSSKLSFVSCSDSTYSGGGGGYVGVVGEKASITLKAEEAGSASVSVSGSDGVIFSTGEEIGSLAAGGTKITVNNAAGNTNSNDTTENNNNNAAENTEDNTEDTGNKSGDNSLSALSISPGSLSPAFKYSTTSYTAAVGADVNEIVVDAKVSNSKATVESITGNTNLKEGANTISIVVKAENGTTATYKIVITKGGAVQEPEEEGEEEKPEEETEQENSEAIIINGHEFDLAATIPADKIPADFTKTTVQCKGQEVEALQFDKGKVVLIYLTTPDTEVKNTLAVYDQESGSISPFVKVAMGNSYYIILNTPAETGLPDTYTASTVEIGENGAIPAYGTTEEGLADFCLIYAVSNSGNTGWYQYDKTEGTLQRYIAKAQSEPVVDEEVLNAEKKSLQNSYDKLNKEYKNEKSTSRKTTAILIFLVAVLLVVVVNLILRGRKEEDEWEDDFSEVPKRFREKEEPEEERVTEKKTAQKKTAEKRVPEQKAVEKEVPEQKMPEKKVPEQKMPEEKDDFEVIDLDDL